MKAVFQTLVAALLITSVPLAAAPVPISDAQFAHFMAVVPDHEKLDAPPPPGDPARLQQLAIVNPGKEAVLRPILDEEAACQSRTKNDLTRRIMRQVLDAMGAAKSERLIAFYGGPALARFDALARQAGGMGPKGRKAAAQLAVLMKAYPVEEFGRTLMATSYDASSGPDLPAGLAACTKAFEGAMAKAGLKGLPGAPQFRPD